MIPSCVLAEFISMDPFLHRCLDLAAQALDVGGFPIGSIIVADGKEIAAGFSAVEPLKDVTAHAEIQAIRSAGLAAKGGILYSSLEPCMMCLAACAWAGVRRVVFGCSRQSVHPALYETSLTSRSVSALLLQPIEVTSDLSIQAPVVKLIRRWQRLHVTP